MSGFSNPFTDAAGTIIRTVLKSFGFQTGVTGWEIARSGNAEFNNATVRGTVQVGPFTAGGSQVTITNVASQAEILINPPTNIAGVTSQVPADLLAFGQTPGSPKPVLEIDSPGFNGHAQAIILMEGSSADNLIDPIITIDPSGNTGGAKGTLQMNTHDWVLGTTQGNVNMPMGRCGLVESSANSAAVGAETVVMTINAPLIRTGRAYEFRIKHTIATTVPTVVTHRVRQNSAVGAVISDRYRVTSDTNFNSLEMELGRVKNVTGTDDNSKNAVLTLQANAGTVQQVAAATRWRSFELWDIGSANDFPNATPW